MAGQIGDTREKRPFKLTEPVVCQRDPTKIQNNEGGGYRPSLLPRQLGKRHIVGDVDIVVVGAQRRTRDM